jgi:CelD/BcsL family acetyltransferase involved in cellulose biosynthesis
MSEPRVSVARWDEFLPAAEPEWRGLWERTGARPDLGPMWAEALVVSHAVDRDSLGVVVSRTDGELDLVWPFCVAMVRKGPHPPLRQLGPLQNVHCLHAGILTSLEEAEAVRRILGALRAARIAWDWIRIVHLHVGSPVHAAWTAVARETGSPSTASHERRSPYIALEGRIEDLLARRSQRFRKVTRGLLRALAAGEARIREFRTPAELGEFRGLAHDIETRSWKHAAQTSIAARPWEAAFYDELLSRFGPGGAVIAATLDVDGTPVAHSLDLQHGSVVFGLKTSFDPSFAEQRPGVMLLAGLIARYLERGVREYDLLGEAEPYKMHWTDCTRDQVTLRVFGASPLGRALHLAQRVYRRLRP